MIAHDELVKGHIYGVKRSTEDFIALYLGYDVCLIFLDCGAYGFSPVDTWSRMSNYTVEQDVTEDYEFGLEEVGSPWSSGRSRFYCWGVRTRNYEIIMFFDVSHALPRMKDHFRYGVRTICISYTGTFTFQEGRLHISGTQSADDLVLQDILLELLTRGMYGNPWE